MKKELTKEWKQLHADTMAFLENLSSETVVLDAKVSCKTILCIRDKKEGRTIAYRIAAYNNRGVFYLDRKNERCLVEWKKVREWNLFSFIEDVFTENDEAIFLWQKYSELQDATRKGFETYIEEKGGGYHDQKLTLRFVIENKPMKLYRTGEWGVILKDKNGEMYEDDFTGLDMASRCKLVEYLSA